MLNKILSIFTALKQGYALTSSTTWKHVQVATNALAIVIGAILTLAPGVHLTPDDVLNLATGIALIGGVINGYLTVATTEKIGLPVSAPVEQLLTVDEQPEADVPPSNSLNGGAKTLGGK